MIEDVVVMIPALNPDNKFITFIKNLKNAGYKHIITIDDGSNDKAKELFVDVERDFGCYVLRHSINLGQGRAYKTGFNYYLSEANSGGGFFMVH